MASKTIEMKDNKVFEAVRQYPRCAFIWYIIASYCLYVRDKPILSAAGFKRLEAATEAGWDAINHPLKDNRSFSYFKTGKNYPFNDRIPKSIRDSADTNISDVYKIKKGSSPPVQNKPSVPKVVLPEIKGAQPVPPKSVTARVEMKARIYLGGKSSVVFTPLQSERITELLAKSGFRFMFEGNNDVLSMETKSKPLCFSRTLTLLKELSDLEIPVHNYIVSETIIDGNYNDVWDVGLAGY